MLMISNILILLFFFSLEDVNNIPVFKIWVDSDTEAEPSFLYVLEEDKRKSCYSNVESVPSLIGYEPISANMSNMVIDDIKMTTKDDLGIIYLRS